MKAINHEKTSKEAIIQVCCKIVAESGLNALNMRAVANECGIAPGTLYNYFSDKEKLLIATIDSLWQDFFRIPSEEESQNQLLFSEYVERLFRNVQGRYHEYPDFIAAHSAAIASGGKSRARNAMEQCTEQIRESLLKALQKDSAVISTAFDEEFTEESFVEFVLDNIILLMMQNKSCDTLIAVISRIIYWED